MRRELGMTGSGNGDWAAPGAPTPPPSWSVAQPPPVYPPPTPPPGWTAPPAGAWAPYVPAAPRPGIIPLRPLSVGEILDGAFTAIRRYPRTVLGLSAGVAAVQQLIGLLVDVTTGGLASPTSSTSTFTALGTVSGVISAVINAVLATLFVGLLTLV